MEPATPLNPWLLFTSRCAVMTQKSLTTPGNVKCPNLDFDKG